MNLKTIGALALAALMIAPALGQDDAKPKKKGKKAGARRTASAQLMKQLEPVGLTEDQVAKIKELGTKAGAEMKAIRDAAGITPELIKKRAEVQKSMKDSDKKGKELQAAINEAAGFTAAHAEAMQKSNAVRMKLVKEVVAMLSDEQKEKLPQQLKRAAGAGKRAKGKADGQPKKKKKDAA